MCPLHAALLPHQPVDVGAGLPDGHAVAQADALVQDKAGKAEAVAGLC